ncbi:MAG: hypothetical protein BGO69_03970 [Bacteroidetes bacterium 46-16]|nr:MAG: hypothetical protein BGO69_03970 [Bacteroidetes bacterium 46-16]
MKRFIAYICLFVFFLQAVPVKQIGRLLGKCTNTEEVQNEDGSIQKEKKDDVFHYCQYNYHLNEVMSFSRKISILLHKAEQLHESYPADILTPPPNRC